MKTSDLINNYSKTDGSPKPETYNQHPDHEVQMARSELYRAGKCAIELQKLLKHVGERQGLEGWVQAKITKAADYLESVYHYMDYEMRYPSQEVEMEAAPMAPSAQAPGASSTAAGTDGEEADPKAPPGTAPKPPAAAPKTPGQQPPMKPGDTVPKTMGMVKMAKVDTQGHIQGTPVMVPSAQIKTKQMAGFHVVGESASAGASSSGGMAAAPGRVKDKNKVGSLFGGSYKQPAEDLSEIKKGQKDSNGYTKCWPGKHAEGTKKGKNGGRVRNCVPNESVNEAGSPAQQAAIAIAKKKSGKYDKDGERIREFAPSAGPERVAEASYQGWVSNPQANLASRFAHDPDRAATIYKANKFDPKTGLGGYVANRASARDDTNIMIQLQSNLDSAYSKPIKFDDGSSLKIGPGTARKALNKLDAMKPVQRHDAVKNIVASKDAFVAFVKNEGVAEAGWKSAATGAALLGLGAMGAGGQAQAADMNKAGVTNMKAPTQATHVAKQEQLKRYPTDPRPDLKLGSLEDMFFNGNTNHDREIRYLNYQTDSDAKGMTPQQWSDAQGPKNSPMKTLTPDQQAARKKLPLRTANWTPDDDQMPATVRERVGSKTGPKFTGYYKGTDKGKPGKKMVGDA